MNLQKVDVNSTLSAYKKAIKLRKELLTEEEVEWIEENNSQILHYSRPNGLNVLTNFQGDLFTLPDNIEILLLSRDMENGSKIGPYTTVWYKYN